MSSSEFGPGAPSWITQEDYNEYLQWIADEAEALGVTETPPEMVRWIRPDEWATIMGECLTAQGLTVKVNVVESSVDSWIPGNEALENYAWWVCTAKYPQMPDSEHGVFSERTKRIMYEWAAKDLVACLENQGFPKITNIPSYEVFWEIYHTKDSWHPYSIGGDDIDAEDPFTFGRANGIDIEAICPQWPKDGRLDYQYHEEK